MNEQAAATETRVLPDNDLRQLLAVKGIRVTEQLLGMCAVKSRFRERGE
jgi:hypothetical protein